MTDKIELSLVIPIYNEAEILPELHERLTSILNKLNLTSEIILVNDGSADDSLEVMKKLYNKDSRIKIIDFSRNFGHQTAISAGLQHSKGQAVVVMDGDLQDPPKVVPRLVEKWQEGYDVVYAQRHQRKENIFKRMAYKSFYKILKFLSPLDIPLDTGDFGLMNRKVVDRLNEMPERSRFIRGLRSWVGFKQTGIEYERSGRYAGESKYSFFDLLGLALDGIVSFSYLPLQLASYLGFFTVFLALVGIFITVLQRLVFHTTVPGYSATIISVLFLGGIQLISIGIIGEYVGRIYDETKGRPLYVVREKVGFEGESAEKNDKK